MADKREIDETTNTETTGHEWDGIKELDTPMPRWWLWTFYATIVWGFIYIILYPAWPLINGATPGILGYSSRATVAAEVAQARAAHADLDAQILATPVGEIRSNPELLTFAIGGGGAVFRNNCMQCHGAGGQGALGGFPALVDDDWLWGGTLEEIQQTVTHGIRYDADPDTRYSQMPAFGDLLEPAQIDDLTQYVLQISGQNFDAAQATQGHQLFLDNCASCHGEDGKGLKEFGAPNLTDQIWLYGGDAATIRHTITYARFGIMPSFALNDRLRPEDIRKVAIYVHSLGGGQ